MQGTPLAKLSHAAQMKKKEMAVEAGQPRLKKARKSNGMFQLSPRSSPRSLDEVLRCLKDPTRRVVEVLQQRLPMWPWKPKTFCGSDWQEVWITTSYSGIGFAEAAVAELVREFAELGTELKVKFLSACEIHSTPRRALLKHKDDSGAPEHVFGDVCAHISAELKDLLLHRAHSLREEVTAEVHAFLAEGGSQEAKAPLKACLVQEKGQRFFEEMVVHLRGAAFASTSWCYRHQCQCPLHIAPTVDRSAILLMEIAGSTCVAWSSHCIGWGWLDDSSVPCLVWMFATAAAKPDLILHECLPRFKPHHFDSAFGGTHLMRTLLNSPSDWGIPVDRIRRYTLLVSCLRLAAADASRAAHFEMPEHQPQRLLHSSDEELLAADGSNWALSRLQELEATSNNGMDFALQVMSELFFAPLQLDSSVFLVASTEQVQNYYLKRLGRKRDGGAGGGWTEVSEVICASARAYLEAWQKKLITCGELPRDLVSLSQSPWHHVSVYIKPSPCAPTLTQSSFLYSMLGRRLALPAEILQMQGLPVPAMLPNSPGLASRWPFACDLPDIMCESWERKVTGNGRHICQVGSAVLLALAILV